ncbi:MAG: sodium:solute symporter [Actinomycetes bacterium]
MDAVVVVAYFVLMLAVGGWAAHRARTQDEFLVAGRRLGHTMYFGTLSAVVLGGASTIGGVGLGYSYGLSGAALVVILGLGIVGLSTLVAGRLTRLGVYTVSEMLELRYNASARVLTAGVMTAYDLMLTVTSTIAVGTVFDVLLGVPPVSAVAVGGGIVLAYSVLGGMWSVTLTDIVQFAIMTVGVFFVLLPVGLVQAGGPSGLTEELPDSYFALGSIGSGTIVTFFLIYFFGILIGQDIWQRVFTARDDKVARRSGVASGLYCMAYGIAGAVIGMSAKVLLPDLAVPDNAFALLVKEVLPVGVRGLLLAAALAAIMSTASAGLLASATLTSHDLHPRLFRGGPEGVSRTRLYTLVFGVTSIVIACLVNDVVGALTVAYNILVGGLLVPILGGLFWRRATSAGALSASAVGTVVVIMLMILQGMLANGPIYWGLLASAITYVAVSLATPPTPEATLRRWEDRLAGRAAEQPTEHAPAP